MRWVRHVAGMVYDKHTILVETLKRSDYLEDLGVDGRVIVY
jgi:hypothetical protein